MGWRHNSPNAHDKDLASFGWHCFMEHTSKTKEPTPVACSTLRKHDYRPSHRFAYFVKWTYTRAICEVWRETTGETYNMQERDLAESLDWNRWNSRVFLRRLDISRAGSRDSTRSICDGCWMADTLFKFWKKLGYWEYKHRVAALKELH